MAWDEPPPEAGGPALPTASAPWSEPPPEFKPPVANTDLGRIQGSFADPATRAKLAQIAFTEHPINWMEAHAGDALPLAGQAVGGTLGGGLGTAAGLETGPGALATGYGGAVAGAGAGTAAGEALRTGIGKLLGVNQGEVLPQVGEAAKTGAIGEAIGKPVVGALGVVGRNMYDSGIAPVIKKGGDMVSDVLREYGVKTATDLPIKAAAVKEALGNNVVNPILSQAEEAGAKINPQTMTGPLRALQSQEGKIHSTAAQEAASKAGETANYYDRLLNGVGTAGSPGNIEGMLPAEAQPYSMGPTEAMQIKTRVGYDKPANEITGLDKRIQNAEYMGAKNAAEEAVGTTLGPNAKAALQKANAQRGALIDSETAQNTAADNYRKLVTGLTNLRGTDSIAAGAGGGAVGEFFGHPILGAIGGILAKKGFDAARIAQMPAGYYMNKFATSPAAAQTAITAATSPWLNQQTQK